MSECHCSDGVVYLNADERIITEKLVEMYRRKIELIKTLKLINRGC